VLGERENKAQGQPAAGPRGIRVGRYAVLDLLGKGGMGAVYRAYDPKLDRVVALKLLLAEEGAFLSTEARERLLREAQAMARVSHPNIVKVHDVGMRGNDVFIAMDLVDGVTLKGWLDARPRSVREILQVLAAAGEGLAAAHDVGLVHRDFKPGNVLVDRAGRAFVTDFGLARLVDGSSSSEGMPVESGSPPSAGSGATALSTELTLAGTVVGTPAYMPPEQHRGEALDGRSDQFSFCVALFEALFGHRPFEGQRSRELVSNISKRRIRWETTGRKAPRWLRPILARGLAPEPWQRFASMQALLGSIARGRARSRWIRGTVAAACVAAATLGGTWLLREHRAASMCGDAGAEIGSMLARVREQGRPRARLEAFDEAWRATSRQACLEHEVRGVRSAEAATSARNCLDEQRLQVSALVMRLDRATPQAAMEATARLPRPADCLDRRIAAHAIGVSEHSAELAEAWAAHAAGEHEEATDVADEIARRAAREGDNRLAARAHLLAAQASLAGNEPGAAEAHALEAVDLAEAGGLDRLVAAAWLARAQAHLGTGAADEEVDRIVAFADAALRRAAADASLVSRLDLVRSQRLLERGRLDDAREQALVAWSRLRDAPYQDLARISALETLARIAAAQRRPGDAAGLWLQVVARAEAAFGPDHARVGIARHGLTAALVADEGRDDG